MGKLLTLLTLTTILVSCNNVPVNCGEESKDPQAETANCPVETAPPDEVEQRPDVGEVPSEAFLFNANVSLTNFDSSQEAKVLSAIDWIKKIIRTKKFKEKVYNFSYNGKFEFVDNKGFSNSKIYQTLIDGSETLLAEVDNEMDLDLELYTSNFTSTVGYTYPNVLRIWMNTKYFNNYTVAQVAGNVFHEWTHKLGYDHASSYSKARDYSVPYGLGYIMVELINEEIEAQSTEK